MRVMIYLVVFVMFASSACKPLARNHESYAQRERHERIERMSWKKKALIIAGAGLAVFGGYRIAKYLDQVIGAKILDSHMTDSFLTRPPLKNYTIKEDKLPLYKLTAPDGSEHWLAGTMHAPAVSLRDLPEQSRLRDAFEKSTTLIPETKLNSYVGLIRVSAEQARIARSTKKTKFNLGQALGDRYVAMLNKEAAQIIRACRHFDCIILIPT